MAHMYPLDIENHEKATEGERKVHRFLREAAKPHADFIAWYEPPIGTMGAEPDFVFFGKKLGLLVFEVKDWTLRQIKAYTPFEFTLRFAGKTEKKTNPDKQAKGYVNALMERLKAFPEFISDLPGHEGGLRIPIGRMVVFPNVERKAYCDRALQWLIPIERTLFGDDLAPGGEIISDPSGKKFFDRLSGAVPFRFRGLGHKEFEKLKIIMWPESQIALPLREGQGKARFQREVRLLDEAQARLALCLKPGHQIIKGPPGSGKTLVLVHRCCHLRKYQGRKRILFVCYNIALVGYLKRLIHEKRLGTGERGVHVHHFFQLCSLILGESLHYENEEPDYYDLVVEEVVARLASGRRPVEPFDAIFVDEAQDFSGEMLRALLLVLKDGGDLVIALDSYQDLYRRRNSWRALGISATGRVHHLRNAYRNTAEIHDFTQRFLGLEKKQEQQLSLDLAFQGEIPLLKPFRSMEDIEEFLIRDMEESVGTGGCKRSEIALIYDDKVYRGERFAYDNRALPMRLLSRLDEAGIPAAWVSQDVRAKEMFDVTTDRVSLISIHSSKGLDFDLVYLVGMDRVHVTEKTWPGLKMLAYVAMTRAKYRLVIPYVQETELIKRIKACLPI